MRGGDLEVVELAGSVGPEDCLVWDEDRENPALSFLMANMTAEDMPVPLGVFRKIDSDTYESGVTAQIDHAISKSGPGTLEDLIYSGETWTVNEDGSVS